MTVPATKVLVVEDNPGDLFLIEDALADAGDGRRRFEVSAARDLAGAAAALGAARPDVVMLDLHLPDSTGLDTVRRVRELAGDIPIVVMSGNSSEIGFEAMRIGAQDYLLKGEVSPSQLRRSLHHAISRHGISTRLQESESKFHALFSHARVPMVCAALDGSIIEGNDAFCELTGYSRDELLRMRGIDLAPLRTQQEGSAALLLLAAPGTDSVTFEGELIRADGAVREVVVTAGKVRDGTGATQYTSAVVQDVTAQRAAQRQAAASERRFHSLVEHVSDVISVHDRRGHLTFCSPSGPRLLGLDCEDGRGAADFDVLSLVHHDDLARLRLAFADWLDHRAVAVQYRLRRADGAWIQCESVATNLLDDPAVGGIVVTTRDVSERQRAIDDLSYQAMHDALTGLPNRSLFHDRLTQAIARHRRTRRMLGVLFLDLDNFKYINDSYGHQVGDEVLLAAAEVLGGSIRPGDTIARLGGDEFAVVCEDVGGVEVARALAERLQEVLRAPFAIGDLLIHVSASIGIALATVEGPEYTATDLLRDADAALYQAKDRGRARAEVFDDELRRRAVRRLKVEEALRSALASDELEVRYQPQFSVGDGVLIGFEALLRWTHPSLGHVPPDEFIPVAESGGLIAQIGLWVLEQACRQLAVWRSSYPQVGATVAVNLSARQIADDGLIEAVALAIERNGLDPAALCLEVTESVLMEDAPTSVATLRRLKALGVRIAIDDFGTGYSSLAYLKRFPIDYLKVDRTFVSGLGRDAEDTVIVASVIDLAGRLGLSVVAEGVETQAQLDELHLLGCGYAQGYLWGPAVPAADAEAHLRAPRGAKAQVVPAGAGSSGDEAAFRAEVSSGVDDAVEVLASELRTPITVIRGFAETLEELVQQGREDMLPRALAAITRQTDGMESLLASLGDVRRIDDGTLVLHRSPVDLATLVAAVVEDVRGSGHRSVFDIATESSPTIVADPARLRQILVHLLTNAAQQSPPDQPVTIVVRTDAASDAAEVRVVDRGPGVPPGRVAELFRKFSRLDNTRKGAGLGLYLARGLARAHGGEIRYRAADAGGAEFVLTIPMSTTRGRAGAGLGSGPGAPPPTSVPVPAGGGLKTSARVRATSETGGADVEALRAVQDATRALLHVATPEEVVAVAIDLVHHLGGRTVTPEAAGADAIPVDLAFGIGDPLLVTAPAMSMARMRLQHALPSFLEDARAVLQSLRHREGIADPGGLSGS